QEARSPEVVVVEQRDVFSGALADEQCLVAGGPLRIGSLCVRHARIGQISLNKRPGLLPTRAFVRDLKAPGAEALSEDRLDRRAEVYRRPPRRNADVDNGLRCSACTHSSLL